MSETNERSVASAGSVWPLAWAVASGSHRVYDVYDTEGEAVAICLWLRDEENDGSWVTVPLYRLPRATVRLPFAPSDFEISERNGYAAAIEDFKRALAEAGIEWVE